MLLFKGRGLHREALAVLLMQLQIAYRGDRPSSKPRSVQEARVIALRQLIAYLARLGKTFVPCRFATRNRRCWCLAPLTAIWLALEVEMTLWCVHTSPVSGLDGLVTTVCACVTLVLPVDADAIRVAVLASGGGEHSALVFECLGNVLTTVGVEALSNPHPGPHSETALITSLFLPYPSESGSPAARSHSSVYSFGDATTSMVSPRAGAVGDAAPLFRHDDVLAFLRSRPSAECGWNVDAVVSAYLEHVVGTLGDSDSDHHTQLALLYVAHVRQLLARTTGPLINRVRKRAGSSLGVWRGVGSHES